MITFQSFEEILEQQCDKLRELETVTIFIKSKDAMREELSNMRAEVSRMSNGIEAARRRLQEMREQNDQCRELLSLTKSLDERITHMEKNVPFELISDYQNKVNSLNNSPVEEFTIKSKATAQDNIQKQQTPKIDCKRILFTEPEVYPTISLINEIEFSKIPKYIIGRQSLEAVNSLIDTINQILKAKYTFLSLGKAHARKQGDLSLYLHYKKQELDICNDNEYVYFFTAEDYQRQTKSKLNKIKLNLLTVLRHCKRLREHRVKNDLRYVIITK